MERTNFSFSPMPFMESIGSFSYNFWLWLISSRESSGKILLLFSAYSSRLTTQSEMSKTFLLLILLTFILEFWEMFEIEILSILEREPSEEFWI